MAKKKSEPIEKTNANTIDTTEGYTVITPEEFMQLQGGGMQTVMNIGLAEKLYLDDLQDRIFYLDGEVNEDILHSITMQIYKINGAEVNNTDKENMLPIIIVINSGGGSVLDGLALCDAINQSQVPIIGVCVGYAYSMAFNIFTQCHIRVATKNSSFLYHDGWTCDSNTTSKVKDAAKFYEKVDERVNKMIANRTKLTTNYLSSVARADNYWFADEGKENGFVDAIIGEDISMGELFGYSGESDGSVCTCDKCNDN